MSAKATHPLILFFRIACCGLLLLTFVSQRSVAGQKLRVYFLGNSYIYTNSLPQMIADVASSMGDTLIFDEHTVGGWRLYFHTIVTGPMPDSFCVPKIKNGTWDYIVEQEQSQVPSWPTNGYLANSFQYAGWLDTLKDHFNPCAKTMFYMTWGYENGDPSNCGIYPPPFDSLPCTYEGMDSLINARYQFMADSLDEVVAPVGAVRHYIRHHYPGISLYQSDGSHPTVAGTYAAACTFYAALFRRDPRLITYNPSLPIADADSIRTAAKKVVLDSLAKWKLGVNDLSTSFTYSIGASNSVSFTNTSAQASSYHWNFGDGATSSASSPVHTYSAAGTYTVALTAYNSSGNCPKTIYRQVNTTVNDIEDASAADAITISPNPATDFISLSSGTQQLQNVRIIITDRVGRVCYDKTFDSSAQRIDISTLSPGMYFISLYQHSQSAAKRKFIKL